jgi:hypothetical protein
MSAINPSGFPNNHRMYMMTAIMIAAMRSVMVARWFQLPVMCRSRGKRVFSGTSDIPHFGHVPGFA